jgi:hypothetical protein
MKVRIRIQALQMIRLLIRQDNADSGNVEMPACDEIQCEFKTSVLKWYEQDNFAEVHE